MTAAGKLLPGYQAKPGAHLDDEAVQAIGSVIDALNKRCGATPEGLVEAAKNPSSPIHRYFEWNDKAAANQHRLSQARYYLRSIVIEWVTVEGQSFKLRAFNPREGEDKVIRWPPLREAIKDDTEVAILIERAKGELRAFRSKYAALRALFDGGGSGGPSLMRAIDKFLGD